VCERLDGVMQVGEPLGRDGHSQPPSPGVECGRDCDGVGGDELIEVAHRAVHLIERDALREEGVAGLVDHQRPGGPGVP